MIIYMVIRCLHVNLIVYHDGSFLAREQDSEQKNFFSSCTNFCQTKKFFFVLCFATTNHVWIWKQKPCNTIEWERKTMLNVTKILLQKLLISFVKKLKSRLWSITTLSLHHVKCARWRTLHPYTCVSCYLFVLNRVELFILQYLEYLCLYLLTLRFSRDYNAPHQQLDQMERRSFSMHVAHVSKFSRLRMNLICWIDVLWLDTV